MRRGGSTLCSSVRGLGRKKDNPQKKRRLAKKILGERKRRAD